MRFIEKYTEVIKKDYDTLAADDGRETLTYGQLDERASKVYEHLRLHGISKEDFVMVLLPRSVNTIAAILGVFKAGVAVIPMEDTYPGERIEFIKKDTGCRLVIDSVLIEEIYETMTGMEGYEETGLHDAAYAIYTSGSTGKPKGVVHEYGNQAMVSEYDGNDTHGRHDKDKRKQDRTGGDRGEDTGTDRSEEGDSEGLFFGRTFRSLLSKIKTARYPDGYLAVLAGEEGFKMPNRIS